MYLALEGVLKLVFYHSSHKKKRKDKRQKTNPKSEKRKNALSPHGPRQQPPKKPFPPNPGPQMNIYCSYRTHSNVMWTVMWLMEA
jgi:hypothetical protein